jgi:SnoaL-like domain
MDAQGTMRLMFDTMDAYDRGDFDRLAEVYAEDAQWINADAEGPHCHNRDDIFTMFRHRRAAGIRIAFDEMRSTPTQVALTSRLDGRDPIVTVFRFEGRRITEVHDYPPTQRAESMRGWRRWWRRWRPGSPG